MGLEYKVYIGLIIENAIIGVIVYRKIVIEENDHYNWG
jgi:hypothetical protein